VERNEAGMETMQSVVITGISAVALAATYQWRWAIIAWVQSFIALTFKIPL
jgi:hypothetical protein